MLQHGLSVSGRTDGLTICSYFGKVGMRHFHLTRNQYWKPTINLDKVSNSTVCGNRGVLTLVV